MTQTSEASSPSRLPTRSLWTRLALLATDNVSPRLLDTLPQFNFRSTVQKDFVQTVRAVEHILSHRPESGNITAILQNSTQVGNYSDEIKSVLKDSAPVLHQMVLKYGSPDMLEGCPKPVEALTTKYVYLFRTRLSFGLTVNASRSFMDTNWQHKGAPNPADAKDGPQTYDDHLYYGFGVSLLVWCFRRRRTELCDHRASPIPIQRHT